VKTVWTGIGLAGAALLSAQIWLFGPVDIWARNAADFIMHGAFLGLAALLAFLAGFVPLAVLVALAPARWRPAVASALAGLAILAWIYSSLLFRDSLAIDGRDELLNLASPIGPAELPLLAAAVLALTFVVWRIPRPNLIFLLVLLAGNAVLTIARLVTVRTAMPDLRMDSADPLWRFSRQGNVLAILLDGLQSDVAAEELNKDAALAGAFEGFTLFKNTTGVAPTTFPTMPTIHSGALWEPDRSLVDQYEERVRKGSFLVGLAGSGYETSVIGVIRSVCPQGTVLCSGPSIAVGTRDGCPQTSRLCRTAAKAIDRRAAAYLPEIATLFDMSILRVAPYALKSVVYNSGNWMLASAMAPAYSVEDTARSREMLEALAEKLVVDDGPQTAKFLHVSATHQPYVFDAACNRQLPTIAGGMENAARCSLRSVAAILKRLKALRAYDSATVLVFADHGAGWPSRYQTGVHRHSDVWPVLAALANPVLMVKPPSARGALASSLAQASVMDIAATVCDLTRDCTTLGGRSLYAAGQPSPPAARRMFHVYQWRPEYWSLKIIPGVRSFAIIGPPWEPASWHPLGLAPSYALGTPIDLKGGEKRSPYLAYGWSDSEAWGTWADGDTAILRLAPVPEGKADLILTVQARAFLAPQTPRQDIAVLVNGRPIGSWSFDSHEMTTRELRVPADAIQDFEAIQIAFTTTTARSPAELGISSDARRLSIGVAEVSLRLAEEPSARAPAPPARAEPYRLGDTLDFKAGGNAAPYLGSGWAQREAWGTWSDGASATLRLSPVLGEKADLVLSVQAQALVVPRQPRQEVDVLVNGRQAGTWAFENANIVKRELRLPAAVIGDFETIEIAFVARNARSPAELGMSSDTRRLGIGIAEARLQVAEQPAAAASAPQAAKAEAYRLGDMLDFRTNGNAAPYLGSGWAQREAWGTWTDGDMAILRLSPTPQTKEDLILSIRAFGLIAAQIPRQEVEVRVNGRLAGTWVFDSGGMADRELRLPADLVGNSETIEIAFLPKNARAPAELGLSADQRRLGMAVAEMTLRAAVP
jgi:hypothetical protein